MANQTYAKQSVSKISIAQLFCVVVIGSSMVMGNLTLDQRLEHFQKENVINIEIKIICCMIRKYLNCVHLTKKGNVSQPIAVD